MSASSGSRARAHYSRKRTVQACLTCRARKSRCDGLRPRCSFCTSSDSECHYPDTEIIKLDKGSLQILDRISMMEDNILRHIAASPGRVPPIAVSRGQTLDGTIYPCALPVLWPNGDIVMTWKSMSSLVSRCPESRSLLTFYEELAELQKLRDLSTISISPTIRLKQAQSNTSGLGLLPREQAIHSPYSSQGEELNLLTPEWITMRVCDYVAGIHSTSPILDLQYLRMLADLCITGCIDYHTTKLHILPLEIEAADVAIFLLVLALGDLTSLKDPQDKCVGFNICMETALPWLGLARFGDCIKDLQTQLLLTSFFMWTLRHWEAWCTVEAMASKAEQVLLSSEEILNKPLNHRVFWAVAKMQLELSEECQIHRPSQRPGRLIRLISATSLPEPPSEPCIWPNIDPDTESDAWFYYLAETSSRRLVERIKTEMYSDNDMTNEEDHLAALYPLACELERQVEGWMRTIPVSFDLMLAPTPSARTMSSKELMRVSLWNRMAQLQMLIFRRYIMTVADQSQELDQDNPLASSTAKSLLSGARKYIWYAMMFLQRQPKNPKRHYGSWLLARNIWSASLTLVAICNSPSNLQQLETDFGGGEGSVDSPEMIMSPMAATAPRGSLYMEAMNLGDQASSLLRQWRFENSSLSLCADLLTFFLSETRSKYEHQS